MDDLSDNDRLILKCIRGFTMTSVERQAALIFTLCVTSCVAVSVAAWWSAGSGGAEVVWLRPWLLAQERGTGRDLYLFDTFDGMTNPTEVDKTVDGTLAQVHLDRDVNKTGCVWAVAGLADVRANMNSTGYPRERVHFVRGPR